MLPSSSRGDARRLNEHVTRDLSLRRPRPRASESIKGELSRARFILKYPPSAGYSQRRNCTHTYSLYASAPSGNSFSSAPARTNHKRRLAVIALVLLGSVGIWFLLRGRAVATNATPEIERSVVVVPFDNASRDTAQEYFANGLTDELTGRLAQVGLRVTGRNTAYTFKGKHPTPQEAGRVAGVATVLTGTVRRLGDRVRVSAELARASDNAVLWTFASERAVPEIVALLRDMVDSIATRLAVTSRVAQRADASVDPRAYDLVPRARCAANQVTREGIARSLLLFDSALVLQPRLVDALIGKEIALGYLADGYESPRKVVPTMDSLLRVAMSTDSTRPDVVGNAALLNAGWVTNWALARRFAADARRRALQCVGDVRNVCGVRRLRRSAMRQGAARHSAGRGSGQPAWLAQQVPDLGLHQRLHRCPDGMGSRAGVRAPCRLWRRHRRVSPARSWRLRRGNSP